MGDPPVIIHRILPFQETAKNTSCDFGSPPAPDFPAARWSMTAMTAEWSPPRAFPTRPGQMSSCPVQQVDEIFMEMTNQNWII